MVLRVYAIYGRSLVILGLLLVVYIIEIIFTITPAAIYSPPGAVTGMLPHTLCNLVAFKRVMPRTHADVLTILLSYSDNCSGARLFILFGHVQY